jgi:hypothetical protein
MYVSEVETKGLDSEQDGSDNSDGEDNGLLLDI